MTHIDFAPHIPATLLWALVAVAGLVTAYGFYARARGAWARMLAFAVLLFALAGPIIVREVRVPLDDVVALVIDHSQSMTVGTRMAQQEKALAQIRKELGEQKNISVRESIVTTTPTGENNGTEAFAALNAALADVPPDRVAGAILVSDGQIHDAPAPARLGLHAPLHALIAGAPSERDRKLTIVDAARFVIVGQKAEMTLRVDDFASQPGGSADIAIRVDGKMLGKRVVPVGQNTVIPIPIQHEGENVIEVAADPGPDELTLENNHAVVTVSGVRDRLRVLLISGQPNAGERVWRNLLKADASVDLVHFTILRPPSKQDATPVRELALIAFPVEELFSQKLGSFDLIIFDRYSEEGILPLAYFSNIAAYVQNGGALLMEAGPEFSGPQSVYRTPLAAILPAQPTGELVAQGFKPAVTKQGLAHPVTQDLPGGNTATTPPRWGRWFRLLGARVLSGTTVMSGPQDRPLLVLDNVGKGRIAELLSDQAWLWARNFEGGGPEPELLRRLAHWLMKEPELEAEQLSADVVGGKIRITRRTMADAAKPVTVTTPSGKEIVVTPAKIQPGLWRGFASADELGLYHLNDGALSAVAAAGPLNPKEVADMRATDAILKPLAVQSGGSVHWLRDGIPHIRRVGPGERASGSDWIGLRRTGSYRVSEVEQQPLLPAWLALLLVIGTLFLAWRMEGR